MREDGTPYYYGKGKGNRAYVKHKCMIPKDRSLIEIVKDNISSETAFMLEIMWIAFWGRKDNGTGILQNKTDGGEGTSNMSEESKKKMSEAKIGKRPPSCDLRKSYKGENNPFFGKHHSDETKAKLREDNIGKTMDQATKDKISVTTKGRKQSPEHIAKRFAKIREINGR